MNITEYLELQSPLVQRNIKVVTSTTENQDYMLHIDPKTPRWYYPRISPRAASQEDRTIPRITVAPSIMGCLIGYGDVTGDHIYYKNNGSYGAIYDINILPFVEGLKPTNKLVFDANLTKEVWLVTYNKSTYRYAPKTIGQILIQKIIHERNGGHKLTAVIEAYLHIKDKYDIKVSNKGGVIGKGYYKLIGDLRLNNTIELSPIPEDEYRHVKLDSLGLESLTPSFGEW